MTFKTGLTFPTLAEQALAAWKASTKTTSLTKICKQRGATHEYRNDSTENNRFKVIHVYTFNDDTSIETTGRGPNHQVTTHLP